MTDRLPPFFDDAAPRRGDEHHERFARELLPVDVGSLPSSVEQAVAPTSSQGFVEDRARLVTAGGDVAGSSVVTSAVVVARRP